MAQAATAESLATREPEQRSGRPSIQLRDIYKLFGEVAAVNGVSLEVRQGEFLTLLGPSGCGKTTTLRMIGGFELPSAGDILIEGEAMGDRPPYRRPQVPAGSTGCPRCPPAGAARPAPRGR